MDINIQGPGVAAQHCYIENRSGVITLHPCGNLCAVDGFQVTQPVRLSQGRNQLKHLSTSVLFLVALHLKCIVNQCDQISILFTVEQTLQETSGQMLKDLWFLLNSAGISPIIIPVTVSERSIHQLSAWSMKMQRKSKQVCSIKCTVCAFK